MLTRPKRLRRRLAVVVIAAVVGAATAAISTAAHASTGRQPADCVLNLDCGMEDINLWTMDQRLQFVRSLEVGPASYFQPNFHQWYAVEGVLEFFRDHQLGRPQDGPTWISYTDAGILLGVERGTALALGKAGNPTLDVGGAYDWRDFLLDLSTGSGNIGDRATHDLLWSTAEQASTDYGKFYAEQAPRNLQANDLESRWFGWSQAWRWMLRNEAAIVSVLQYVPLVGNAAVDQLHAALGVTDSASNYWWASFAWYASIIGVVITDVVETLKAVIEHLGGLPLDPVDLSPLAYALIHECLPQCSGGGDNPSTFPAVYNVPTGGAFRDAWDAAGGAGGFLGSPLGNWTAIGGGRQQLFSGGAVEWSPTTGTFEVHGAIYSDYAALNGPTGPLGFPTSNEMNALGGGRQNMFAGSSCGIGSVILFTSGTGAHEMQGCIYRDFIQKYGGPAGAYGYPTTNEVDAPGGAGRVNYMSGTPCGTNHASALYWSSGTGTWPVGGCIYQKYKQLGETNSPLGYPRSLEYSTSQGIRQDYTGGYMLWANGVATPFYNGCVHYGAYTTGPSACSGFSTHSTWFSGGGVGLLGKEIWTYANGTVQDSTATYSLTGMDTTHVWQLQAYIPNNHSNASHAHYHYCSPGGGCADGYVNQNNFTNQWAVFGAVCTSDGTASIVLADNGGDVYPAQVGADAIRAVRLSVVC